LNRFGLIFDPAASQDCAARHLISETTGNIDCGLTAKEAFACCAAKANEGFMVKITFIDSHGEARTVEAEEGSTVMETAIRNAIPEITAECGGGCACATCHVYVAEKWAGLTGKASDQEEDMLDFAYKVQPSSRLSCQIKVTAELDGLVITTPDQQG
jgi:ferredoxin, 2Fe-2S